MIETEVKIKINECKLKEIVEILGKPKYFSQENIIHELKEGIVRLRREKGEIFITYKGKRKNYDMNVREEIEFTVKNSNLEKILNFFNKIGFDNWTSYCKKRANFSHRECVISIDILPNKDIYLEIEGNRSSILECLDEFNLRLEDSENRSYLEIIRDAR